jgi:hypothetical protein
MKIASLIVAATLGAASFAFAQTDAGAYISSPQSPAMDPLGSRPTSGPKASNQYQDTHTAEEDDSLYRGKTGEMETTFLRDEGALHFKTHGKEKVQEVDSLKNLKSKATDTKFQGNFAISGVSSIDSVAAKAPEQPKANQAQEAKESEEQGDPRFSGKHPTFKPQTDDKPKKADADSSPSPSPSASASPAAKAKDSSAQKP